MKHIPTLIALGASLLTFAGSTASGAILLQVDPSNPSAVSFAAIPNFAQNPDSSGNTAGGIVLEDIFAADAQITISLTLNSSNLTPAGAGVEFTDYSNQSPGVGGDTNLNLWRSPGVSQGMDFTTNSPALSGSATADLSAQTLQPAGTTGDIFVLYSNGTRGAVIGQYQIVPEPGTSVLCLGSLAGLLILRRRSA